MPYQRAFEKRIPVAVIGAGSHCYRNILPVMNFLPVELRAICDINVNAARSTAAQYGCRYYGSCDELYEKEPGIEGVFIAVGPELHPQLVLQALRAGKHVWVEKPVACRAKQVEEMIAARNGKIVVVGLKKAFMPAAFKAREIADSKKYGNLKSILAVYHMNIPSDGEEVLLKEEAPNWLRNGVHPLAFLVGVGGAVSEVTALTNDEGYGAVILKFKSGVMGTLHMSSGPQPDVEEYGLYGDSWQMSIRDTRIELRRGIPSFRYSESFDYAPPGEDGGSIVWEANNCVATLENKALFTQGFYNETRYFCDCVLEGRQPEIGTLETALEIMKVYEAGLVSHGRPVKIG